jgi:hypothetical protein
VPQECSTILRCILPSIGGLLRDELLERTIEELVEQIAGGDCTLDEVCNRLGAISRTLNETDRITLVRKTCKGETRSANRAGPRLQLIVPAIEAATDFIKDFIEERLPCGSYSEPEVLAGGTSTLQQDVVYVPVNAEVRQVELEIRGAIPGDVRLYAGSGLNQEQGKFGAIQAAYRFIAPSFSVFGHQQWVWTRGTILDIPEYRGRQKYVRVFLKPGLNWALYDTGLRL